MGEAEEAATEAVEEDGRGLPTFIPVEYFYFHKMHLNRWCDGQQRLLRADVDFPKAMSFQEVRKRLKAAARQREAPLDMWPDGEGNIWIKFGPSALRKYREWLERYHS